MKVVQLITGLGMGGAENLVCNLSDSLINNGCDVYIVSLTGEQFVYPENDIKIISINMEKSFLGGVRGYFKARKIISELQPDVLHSHMYHANILARLLRLSLFIPRLICTAHSNNEGGRLRMLIYRLTDFLADISTNVSQQAVDSFIEKKAAKPGRFLPVYNGVNVEYFSYSESSREIKRKELGLNDSEPLIMAIGRLEEAKNYPNLLKAFAALNLEVKPILAIIGDGTLKEELQKLALQLGIADRVHWLGIQSNIPQWLSASDVFVLSSSWEGFGLVVAEAMACSKLVIATDCGGVKEVLGNSKWLVPSNEPERLGLGIKCILSLPDEEKKLIIACNRKRIVENFSLHNIVQTWLSLYKGTA
ncbi:glycosyltransferase [Pectobacterium punjabense]|uniref:glycosyltransferase n=1 Tax=Pectobacterium punjabense TaxID=2108399 RepID=UPI001968EAC3|nr:glycosyltransferase [Pectobacterium punjabense]MBN3136691.1 glycosyltransferase [Pectobacterium punjabense]MCE5381123.1 glycosyltransferase [Pectobacterium punjabense]